MELARPFSGYSEGLKSAIDLIKSDEQTRYERKRQEELDRRAALEFAQKQKGWQREEETRKGLAEAMTPRTETVEIPEQSAAELMYGQTASGVPEGYKLPSAIPARTEVRPELPSAPYERGMSYLASRGEVPAAAQMGNMVDVTNKIAASGQMPVLSQLMTTSNQLLSLGNDSDQVKNILKMQYPQFAKQIENVTFSKDQALLDLGEGRKGVVVTQPNGNQAVYMVGAGPSPEDRKKKLAQEDARIDIAKGNLDIRRLQTDPYYAAGVAVAKQAGKDLPAKQESARQARLTLNKVTEMEKADPSVLTGISGKMKGVLASWTGDWYPETAEKQQQLRGLLASARKSLGLAGSISDRDVAVMKEWASGGGTEAGFKTLLRQMRANAESDIADYEQAKRATGAGQFVEGTSPYEGVPTLQSTPPATKGAVKGTPTSAINPKTGQRIYVNKSRTGWVDANGNPVK